MSIRGRILTAIRDFVLGLTPLDIRQAAHTVSGASMALLIVAIMSAISGEAPTRSALLTGAAIMLFFALLYFATAWLMEGGEV